jgi:hypothetical protein
LNIRRTPVARWCWLLPALAALLGLSAQGQGTITYVHLPLSNPSGDPSHLPWDSQGTQVGPDVPITINGQNVATFTAGPTVAGQPSQFAIQPSSLSAVIALPPILDFPNDTWVVPLSAGAEIGPGAAGYGWYDGTYDHPELAAYRDSGIIGDPWLSVGYFAGVESAYLGFSFQQGGQTYYGWMRAGSPVVGLNAGWVYDYAYETVPNTPISAGQGVPEPSALSICALGAFVTLLCRARQAGREVSPRRMKRKPNRVGGGISPPASHTTGHAGPRPAVPGSPCGRSSTLSLPR